MSAPRKRKTKRQAAAANAAAVLFYPRSRAPPMAAGGPVPVSQIAATIAAAGDNGPRSSHPPAFSTVSHGKNAAAAGARPSPSRFYPRLPPAERTLRRRALALPLPASIPGCLLRKERCVGGRCLSHSPLRLPLSTASRGKNAAAAGGTCAPARRTRARPGRKRTFPFTTLPAKMKKNAPPGRKRTLSQGIPLEQ